MGRGGGSCNSKADDAVADDLSRPSPIHTTPKADANSVRLPKAPEDQIAVDDVEVMTRLLGELDGRVNDVVEREKELNASRGREYNASVWSTVWKKVGGDRVVEAGEGSQWGEVEQRLLKEYHAQAKGEGKEEVLRRLLGEKRERLMQRVEERRVEERKEAERVRKAAEAADTRAAEAEKEAMRLRMEAAFTSKEVERLQAERKTTEQEVRALRDEGRRLEAAVKELHAEASRQRKEHEREVEELKARLQRAEAERQQSEKAGADRHRREAEEAAAELRSLRRQVEEEKKGRSRAEEQLVADRAHGKEAEGEVKRLKERAVSADDRLTRLQGELAQAQKDAAFYRDRSSREASEGEERSRELDALQQQKRSLTSELQQLRKESEDSSREFAAMEGRVKELVQLRREAEQSKERIAQLEAESRELARARSDVERATERTRKLQAELDDVRAQLSRPRASPSPSPSPHSMLGKRGSDERQEEEDKDEAIADLQMRDDDADLKEPPHSPAAPALPPSRPSAAFAGRRSLAPTRQSGGAAAGSEEPVDPQSLSIPQLKSWLTEMDVSFPMKAEKKEFYVQLVYQALPELEHHFPRQQQTAAAARKGKKAR